MKNTLNRSLCREVQVFNISAGPPFDCIETGIKASCNCAKTTKNDGETVDFSVIT